ncbi:MAG: hypothetical protein PHC84_05015 [Clostridia bacterium]|nr:hypothetical protein [Clostridia bacterium]
MKVLTKKNKRLLVAICAAVLILAILMAVLLPLLLKEEQPSGYSFDNERKPLEYGAVNKLIFNNKVSDILKYSFFVADNNNYIANALISAMRRARIPTQKLKAFADYLGEFVTLLKGSGFSVPAGEFEEGEEQEDGIFSDFNRHFTEFFEKTGFTETELSRFLYELATDFAGDTQYGAVLAALGRDDFVALTSNTIFCYKMLIGASEGGATAYEARSLQAIVYSLGSYYIKIISKLGFSNTEKLLGLDFDEQKEYGNLSEEEYAVFRETMLASRGKVANLFYTLGSVMKETDAYSFELLFAYASEEDKNSVSAKEKLVLSHIELSKAIKIGIEQSYVNSRQTGIADRQSFVASYAALMTQYKKFLHMTAQAQEEVDFVAYEAAATRKLDAFMDSVYYLSAVNPDSLKTISEQDLDVLVTKAEDLSAIVSGVEEYFDKTFSIRFVNFLFKIIDLQGLLERYRRPIEDILEDSLKGLIDLNELEDLLD